MICNIGDYMLRRPEIADLEDLYAQKNNPEISGLLGGFSAGYSREDMKEWLEHHRKRRDEIIWTIVRNDSNNCMGHVGLYKIDYRIRSAEFAIMIGDKSAWGKGLGRACTMFAVDYAFQELNVNRLELTVLSTNRRAADLYLSLGFKVEGTLREAQYKGGRYIDLIVMSLLRSEYSVNEQP